MATHDERYEFKVTHVAGLGTTLRFEGPGVRLVEGTETPRVELGPESTLETLLDLELAVRDEINRLLRARHIDRDEARIKAFIDAYEGALRDDS